LNAADIAPDVMPSSVSSVLRTLVVCDLANTAGLIERSGARAGAELIRKHDRMTRAIADRHGGQEIDKTDGFLLMFERPIQAVGFALDYQRGLRQLNAAEETALAARVGMHVGDVVIWDNDADDIARGAKPVEVEGLVKPIASRLMSLALPGQILLSSLAYALAHRAQGELGIALEKVRWRTHGRYRMHGIPEPVAVFEVGEEGLAPLCTPPWTSKAFREVPFWRRPFAVAFEVLIVALLVIIPLYMFTRPEPAIAFNSRDWVVVGSLRNLTGNTVFDDAAESAMRISLEQSRYVNVLPDLKVRDTIKRMQRDPESTRIDRSIGSEIALRDGARALILPTVAEIGGRVRVSAEVIDPHTQATVYSEVADGIGPESMLASLDTINTRLRVRLGEALTTVNQESRPLEKVTTSDLDALRLYTKGIKAHVAGDINKSNALLEAALELDPDFVPARIALARTYHDTNRRIEAAQQLQRALLNPDRISSRDRMAIDAWLANLSSPKLAIEKWKILSEMYPDLFFAQGSFGYYTWMFDNDYKQAIAATLRGAAEQNPNRGTSLYLLGILYLGEEQYKESFESFQGANSSGVKYANQYVAALFAAQRDYSRMREVLADGRAAESIDEKAIEHVWKIALAQDQGNWREYESSLTAAERIKQSLGDTNEKLVELVALYTKILRSSETERKELLKAYVSTSRVKESTEGVNPIASTGRALFVAWLHARYGESRIAEQWLGTTRKTVSSGNYPTLARVEAVVGAQIQLIEGHAHKAIQSLQPLLDGREPYIAHVVLQDAFRALGETAKAQEQARWLASRRGRAFTEDGADIVWMPYNVAQSTLATLTQAELSSELGLREEATSLLLKFREQWPQIESMPDVAKRIQILEERLKEHPPASQSSTKS
jgi:putative peptide modification system cyclase